MSCVAVDSLYTAVYGAHMLDSRCDGSHTLGTRFRLVLQIFEVLTCVGLQVGLYLVYSCTLNSLNFYAFSIFLISIPRQAMGAVLCGTHFFNSCCILCMQ